MNDQDALIRAIIEAGRGLVAEPARMPTGEVLALVKGIVAARPQVSPAQLLELVGQVGVPRATLERAARGKPASPPVPKASGWTRRVRIVGGSSA